VDSGELEDARWFERAELRAQQAAGEVRLPRRLSISRRLIEEWLAAESALAGGRTLPPGRRSGPTSAC
ncbi:MAG: hypothetical protein ACE5HQ_13885, partial [Gemmatimonadota bacterium]